MSRLPIDIINKRAYPMSDILWGRGLMRWNGRQRMGGWRRKPFDCCILFFILPLKIWVNKNLVMPHPLADIINKRAYLTLDLLWGRGLLRWNGRWRTGGRAESQFDCRVFFSDSPLKNMIDGNLVFPRPPDDIINKRAYPTLDLMWGRGLLRQNGRWRMGGGLKANLIDEFFQILPSKIWWTEI